MILSQIPWETNSVASWSNCGLRERFDWSYEAPPTYKHLKITSNQREGIPSIKEILWVEWLVNVALLATDRRQSSDIRCYYLLTHNNITNSRVLNKQTDHQLMMNIIIISYHYDHRQYHRNHLCRLTRLTDERFPRDPSSIFQRRKWFSAWRKEEACSYLSVNHVKSISQFSLKSWFALHWAFPRLLEFSATWCLDSTTTTIDMYYDLSLNKPWS